MTTVVLFNDQKMIIQRRFLHVSSHFSTAQNERLAKVVFRKLQGRFHIFIQLFGSLNETPYACRDGRCYRVTVTRVVSIYRLVPLKAIMRDSSYEPFIRTFLLSSSMTDLIGGPKKDMLLASLS